MESYMGVGELVSVPFFGRHLIGQLMSESINLGQISQYQWISTRALALVSMFLWDQSYTSHCQDYLLWATILNSSDLDTGWSCLGAEVESSKSSTKGDYPWGPSTATDQVKKIRCLLRKTKIIELLKWRFCSACQPICTLAKLTTLHNQLNKFPMAPMKWEMELHIQ